MSVPWSSTFYSARRVGRSNSSQGHSDDREDGLGGHDSYTRASRMRSGRCNHRTGGFCLTGAPANLRRVVWSPIKPRAHASLGWFPTNTTLIAASANG